ncbi:MAG: hypothetical protein H6Q52_1582, partial [Deltaproteobacteria bacterium]|nr:hypothetical protein [Deltaproteobacteria bacterium]
TPDTFKTVRRLMTCLNLQTARDRLEILFVCPVIRDLDPDNAILENFGNVRFVEVGTIHSTAQARAAGVEAATAPIVVLTEDHCLPEPDWAEALIGAHHQGWDGVGPVVLNGNPHTNTSWANFLSEYNEWLDPHPGGRVRHLPGHNSSFKRDILLGYGHELGMWFESESVLHWDMAKKGYRFTVEPAAKSRHLNYSLFFISIALRFGIGRIFAGLRAHNWSYMHRLFYTLASPLIPFVRLRRILRELRKPGRPRTLIPRVLPCLMIFLLSDGIGQMVGYAFNMGDASRKVMRTDFHRERYMNARDRHELENAFRP